MGDSFRVRVDKAFGSLLSSATAASSSAFPSASLWCLADEEIKKKEWNRDSKITTANQPYLRNHGFLDQPRDYGQQLQLDLDELDDEDDDDNHNDKDTSIKMAKKRINDEREQVWEIRSSIGLDCTLDNEEEEDEFDKVAIGKEKASNQIYTRDMVDYGIDVNDHGELPSSFKHLNRDPRANHAAARLRLKEDSEAIGDLHTLNLSDNTVPPKPILKKRERSTDDKSSKRVRFYEAQSSSPTEDCSSDATVAAPMEEEETVLISLCDHNQSLALFGTSETDETASDLPSQNLSSSNDEEAAASLDDDGSGDGSISKNVCTRVVPDYLRNPTRYVRYSLDSSDDVDEASNRKAYLDFLKVLNKQISSAESQVDEATCETFRQPLTFHPRKKAQSSSPLIEGSKGKAFSVSVAGGCGDDSLDDDDKDSMMDKVGSEKRFLVDKNSLKPPGRHYRARTNMDSDDTIP